MTLMTALEIANNYPKNISIVTFRDNNNGKFGALVYRMKDGDIHKLLLSHNRGIYKNRKEVKSVMNEMMQEVKNIYEKDTKRIGGCDD